jgi:hypothetical protein
MTLEGDNKELASIFELQWFFHDQAFLKLNTGIGLTREATDLCPGTGCHVQVLAGTTNIRIIKPGIDRFSWQNQKYLFFQPVRQRQRVILV